MGTGPYKSDRIDKNDSPGLPWGILRFITICKETTGEQMRMTKLRQKKIIIIIKIPLILANLQNSE